MLAISSVSVIASRDCVVPPCLRCLESALQPRGSVIEETFFPLSETAAIRSVRDRTGWRVGYRGTLYQSNPLGESDCDHVSFKSWCTNIPANHIACYRTVRACLLIDCIVCSLVSEEYYESCVASLS